MLILIGAKHKDSQLARDVVDEVDEKEDHNDKEDELEYEPLQLPPDDELEGLPGTQEPQEGRVWSTECKNIM